MMDVWLRPLFTNAPDNNRMHATGNSVNVIRKIESLRSCVPARDAERYAASSGGS